MPRICVFDVNETLLDLGALNPHFARVFGDAGVRQAWFKQVLQSMLLITVLGDYTGFDHVQSSALDMVAQQHGVQVAPSDRDAILSGMRQLPAHADARPALDRLRDAGVRLTALTNSPSAAAESQLAHAGLRDYFERVFSVDAAQRFKPALEPYRLVAQQLGVSTADLRLIAAHSWDVAGAMHAGCAAAFVARPGQVLDPLFPTPDIVGRDLGEVAERILEREGIVETARR